MAVEIDTPDEGGEETGASDRLERTLPDELRTTVREEDALKATAPYFGRPVVDAVIDAVKGGLGSARITHRAPDGTIRAIDFTHPQGAGEMEITLTGDWKEGEQAHAGLLLELGDNPEPTFLRLFRRLRPEDQPLIEIGQSVEPATALIVAMKGKRSIEVVRLPREIFPNGGVVTEIFVPDSSIGHQVTVSRNQRFAYARVNPLPFSGNKK